MPFPTGYSTVTATQRSGNVLVDALLGPYRWKNTTLTYSYPTYNSVWATGLIDGYGSSDGGGEPWSDDFEPLSSSDKIYFPSAIAKWSNVANIDFVQVSETSTNVGDIRAAYSYGSDHSGAAAWAYFPASTPRAGDIWFNAFGSAGTTTWTPGSYSNFTVLHELGHALGLKHPFSGSIVLPSDFDTQSYTIMSYSALAADDHASFSFYPTTPMLLDIAAIQHMYGANYDYRSDDSEYAYYDGTRYHETIWDGGGEDTIRYAGAENSRIDLNAGTGSSIGRAVYAYSANGTRSGPISNVWIAMGVSIENAIGGQGSDTIVGNELDNDISGGNGDDVLKGGTGNDRLDWLSESRAGADTMHGGPGNDQYVIDNPGDKIVENANEGYDTVWTTVSLSIENEDNIEGILLFGSAAANITANRQDNLLAGNTGNNQLDGGAGFDMALYSGKRGDYSVTKTSSGVSVNAGSDGNDLLISIERIKFADGILALDIGKWEPAGSAYRLYQAAFKRSPDSSGLTYWVDQMGRGQSHEQVAHNFIASSEFTALYGSNPANDVFITAIYSNVLGRAPDQSGYDYWLGLLEQGKITPEQLLINFSESNENVALTGAAIENGIWLLS